MTLFIRRTEDS